MRGAEGKRPSPSRLRAKRLPSQTSVRSHARLQGKRCWVTGGSRGLGLAICREFARVGARVAFTYSKNSQDAERARAQLEEQGAEVLSYQGSVADAAHVQHVASDIV